MRRRASSSSARPDDTGVSVEQFVVDYDLPADSRRLRFYRRIRRYLSENELDGTDWSTGSVVFTQDEKFAWLVYREARKVGGTAHVWRAQRLDGEDGWRL